MLENEGGIGVEDELEKVNLQREKLFLQVEEENYRFMIRSNEIELKQNELKLNQLDLDRLGKKQEIVRRTLETLCTVKKGFTSDIDSNEELIEQVCNLTKIWLDKLEV